MRFDSTGAHGLHVSPHHGAPEAAHNYVGQAVEISDFISRDRHLESSWRTMGAPTRLFNTNGAPKVATEK